MTDVGTTMRQCGNPLCDAEFDIAAHMAGEKNAGPWMGNRLVHYLCPACSAGGHVPNWADVDLKAVAWCSCGVWKGTPATTIAAAQEQWEGHVSGGR